MVVDSVIRHWVTAVVATEKGVYGIDLTIRYLESYFYANCGLIASPQPESLQRPIDVLAGLFDRVGIQTITQKTVSMAFQPCHTPGRIGG